MAHLGWALCSCHCTGERAHVLWIRMQAARSRRQIEGGIATVEPRILHVERQAEHNRLPVTQGAGDCAQRILSRR
jgi:hypothetical protein